MKTQYKTNKISVSLAVRPNTAGDTIAIQKTIDNCAAKDIYLNTINLDGIDTPVVSIETSRGSNTYAHIALDTFILSSVSKMYPRDAAIGGRIPIDGTMLNGVVDSRAAAIRQVLNGGDPTIQTKVLQPTFTSDELLRHSILAAIEERLIDIRAYMLRCYDSVLTNPASYLADNADNLTELGFISLASYEAPFELPVDRINALLQAEKYAAQLQTFKDELVCNKASNFRVHETYLVCEGQPTEEQKTVITAKGFLMYPKDTTALQVEIAQAMSQRDFASVVTLSQELLTMQSTVEIRKALTE